MNDGLQDAYEDIPEMVITVDPNFSTVPHVSRELPDTSITWGECGIHWSTHDLAEHIEHFPTGCVYDVMSSLDTDEERHSALMALDSIVCETFHRVDGHWVRLDV